jgi:hypothetical protein
MMYGTCMSAAFAKDRHAETPASEADAFRERHAKFRSLHPETQQSHFHAALPCVVET